MTAANSKKNIRRQCQQARQSLNDQARQHHSKAITKNLMTIDAFQQAHTIASYMPIDNEVDTTLIHDQSWQKNKTLLLPVIQNDQTIRFTQHLANKELLNNQYGIAEPKVDATSIYITRENIDCILIPLIGFDETGNRIGFGGGYYDKYLENKKNKPICIGLAFEIQKTTRIEKEKWDISMDIIVSEEKNYLIKD